MILSQLSDYLKTHGRAALTDMAVHFDTAPEALRAMLGVLERKGRVTRLPAGTPCAGGCCKCSADRIEIFEWQGSSEVSQ